MKFQDKTTSSGAPECFTTGVPTHNITVIAETIKEFDSHKEAISNLVRIALATQGYDNEDIELMLGYISTVNETRGRQTMSVDQTSRFGRLLLMARGTILDDEQSGSIMASVAEIDDEVAARRMRLELEDVSAEDFK